MLLFIVIFFFYSFENYHIILLFIKVRECTKLWTLHYCIQLNLRNLLCTDLSIHTILRCFLSEFSIVVSLVVHVILSDMLAIINVKPVLVGCIWKFIQDVFFNNNPYPRIKIIFLCNNLNDVRFCMNLRSYICNS